MADRIVKKAKTLFDTREKDKHRYAAFESILEMLTTIEGRVGFFKENAQSLIAFALESFRAVVTRLDTNREFRDRFEKSLGKDVFKENFYFPRIIESLLSYVPELLNASLDSPAVVSCLKKLLLPSSHLILRKEGLRLLFMWMKCFPRDDLKLLFSSSVDLNQFNNDPKIQVGQTEFPSLTVGPPLIESPISLLDQSEAMFEEILAMMTYDTEASRLSLSNVYKEFQRAYLSYLYPAVFEEYKLAKHEGNGFYNGCPIRIQVILVKYVTLWFLRSPEMHEAAIPPACFIFDELLLSSPIDSEIVHEILRQALLLPWEHAPTIKSVLSLLRWWIFQTPRRRPAFLQEDLHDAIKYEDPVEALIELYTDRYIRRVLSLFDGRPSFGVEVGQLDCYRDGIFFLRSIAMGAYFKPSEKIWNNLITTCLTIVRTHLNVTPKQEIITIPTLALSFAGLMTETLAGMVFRSGTRKKEHWEAIAAVLRRCTRWNPVVTEWSRAAMVMTDVLLEESERKCTKSGRLLHLPKADKFYRIASVEDVTAQLLQAPTLPVARSDAFTAWSTIEEIRKHSMFLWRNWIRVLGDVCCIEIPEIHELALKTFATVLESLSSIRAIQAHDAKDVPPVYEFADALIDACDSNAKGFEKSRCVAIASVSSLFCRRPDIKFDPKYHSRFYLAIVNGLVDKDSPVATVCLRASSHVLSMDLPGSTVIVPSYIKCVASILNGKMSSRDVIVSILRIVTSTAILTDVFYGLKCPRIEAPLPIMSAVPVSHAGNVNLEELRHQVQFLVSLTEEHIRGCGEQLIWSQFLASSVVLLVNEWLAAPHKDLDLADRYLGLIVAHMTPNADEPICHALFSAFEAITLMHPLFHLSKDREVFVTQSLLIGLQNHYSQSDPQTVVRMLNALIGWLMVLPRGWLVEHPGIREHLFDALLEGLETEGLVNEAANLAVHHLLHHYDNFAPPLGSSCIETKSCPPNDQESSRGAFLALNNSSIINIRQARAPKTVRLTSRNPIGRFTWELQSFCIAGREDPEELWNLDGLRDSLEAGPAIVVDQLESYLPADLAAALGGVEEGRRDPHRLALWKADTNLEKTDTLADLLTYLGTEFPEMEDSLTLAPDYFPPEHRQEVIAMEEVCLQLIKTESELAKRFDDALRLVGGRVVLGKPGPTYHRPAAPAPFLPAATPFDYGRLLAEQLGLFSLDESWDFPVRIIPKTALLGRELRVLDERKSRECHKIGLIYVGPGCESEEAILGAAGLGSASFRDFCQALGVRVGLAGHSGFKGGLEAEMVVDGAALYFSNSQNEVIFHENLRILLGEAGGDGLLLRKRHIGNDVVHIVWNEHWRAYRPATLSTDFGNFQIVVTPNRPLGLYAINIYADAHFPIAKLGVGPLYDGALVPRALLAPLVLATAIYADRLMMLEATGGVRPIAERRSCLGQITNRLTAKDWPMHTYVSYLGFASNQLDEAGQPESQPARAVPAPGPPS